MPKITAIHYSLLATHNSLPATRYPLSTTRYSLLATRYYIRISEIADPLIYNPCIAIRRLYTYQKLQALRACKPA